MEPILFFVLFLLVFSVGLQISFKKSTDAKLNLIIKHLKINYENMVSEEIIALIKDGEKFKAIKKYRKETGMGQKDAHDIIDEIEGKIRT